MRYRLLSAISLLLLAGCASLGSGGYSGEPFSAVVYKAETETGQVLAFRVVLEDGQMGTCGEQDLPDSAFVKIAEAMSDGRDPFYARDDELNCSILAEYRRRGLILEVSTPSAPNPYG